MLPYYEAQVLSYHETLLHLRNACAIYSLVMRICDRSSKTEMLHFIDGYICSKMCVLITFNFHKKTAVADKTFRKAFMHGINRDRLNKIVYMGYAFCVFAHEFPE